VNKYDVIIVGGGLAGLTAAIHLRRKNYHVLVIEKEPYPHHKVCGEYLSNEVLPYLNSLEVTLPTTISIDTLEFSSQKGSLLRLSLPLGGMGISRYALDDTLYKKALETGAAVNFATVFSVHFNSKEFTVETDNGRKYTATFVIGAYGKRANLDKFLKRPFVSKKSPWLGVKAHYNFPDFPDNRVGLHNFEGGYAGLSKTETGAVNFCYLTTYKSFQQVGNIDGFNEAIVAKNPFLGAFLEEAIPLFDNPLSIAQISFEHKKSIENHMLMCGDTAGLIHPLCGNGMAIAIHSAKIASELIHDYFRKSSITREALEIRYQQKWSEVFRSRLRTGRYLQSLLMQPRIANTLLSTVAKSPKILSEIVKRTHGNLIEGI
jgi:flavin-dependent dehydrogenase